METNSFIMKAKILCCAILACAGVSCVKAPDSKPEPAPEVVTYDDLKLKSLTVSPDRNERIFGTVEFESDQEGVNWKAHINGYNTDLTALKASFEVVAARVTVGETEQQSGVTPNDFSEPVVYRLYADDGRYKEFAAVLTVGDHTGFPVLGIVTDGEKAVVSRDKWIEGRMVIDRQEGECEELSCRIEIKGRGNNTWSREKKPYAIKLTEKSTVMGMKKHKRWVLLANAVDKTLLRNRVAFEIGRRTGMPWTSDSRFVEVVLNGKYLGNYLLCEQIRVDKNRLDITEMTDADNDGEALTGGYLLELDRYYDEVNKFRTSLRDLPVNIKEPDEDVLTEAQRTYITEYVNQAEALIYAAGKPDAAYRDYVDIESFADWWIVQELCHNHDVRLPGSCYMYKDRGGKLSAGPLWDFDMMTFISSRSFLLKEYEVTDFTGRDRSLWFKRLFEDPVFVAKVKERWQAYKPAFETIPAFIEAEAAKIEKSAVVNWNMWSLTDNVNHDEQLPWNEAVSQMKTNYTDRLNWMDQQISGL